jgi:hypothetical protein
MTNGITPAMIDSTTYPLPQLERREPGRSVKIAAIHALADWLTTNPDVPMPSRITCDYWLTAEDEPDEQLRMSAALAAMNAAGITAPYAGPFTFQGNVTILAGAMPITYDVALFNNEYKGAV